MTDRLHNTALRPLDRWRPGEPVSASKANQVVDVVDEMRRGVAGPRQILRVAGRSGEGARTAPAHRMFTLISEQDDHLVCYDEENLREVQVAKRVELRRSTYDGATAGGWEYAYTSSHERRVTRTEDGYFEMHEVWPAYDSEPTIWALVMPAADVNLDIDVPGDGDDPLEPSRVTWMELDLHRAWTRKRNMMESTR